MTNMPWILTPIDSTSRGVVSIVAHDDMSYEATFPNAIVLFDRADHYVDMHFRALYNRIDKMVVRCCFWERVACLKQIPTQNLERCLYAYDKARQILSRRANRIFVRKQYVIRNPRLR
jgi:hypothetical protein